GTSHFQVGPETVRARIYVEGRPPRGRLRRKLARRDWSNRPAHTQNHLEGSPDERDPIRARLCTHDLQRLNLSRLRHRKIPSRQRLFRRLAKPRLQVRHRRQRPPLPVQLRQNKRTQHQSTPPQKLRRRQQWLIHLEDGSERPLPSLC